MGLQPTGRQSFEYVGLCQSVGRSLGMEHPPSQSRRTRVRVGGNAGRGSINYGGDGGAQFPTLDRSVAFPGASSNTSTSSAIVQPTRSFAALSDGTSDSNPPYYSNYNSYWHHGYWGGGLWGWARWGGPLGIGSFARWSFGPIYYSSGYGIFRNPFLAEQQQPIPPFLNYAKPIEDIPDDDEPLIGSADPAADEKPGTPGDEESPEEIAKYLVRSPEVKAGLKLFDAASDAFKNKDYDLALTKSNAALEQLPFEPALQEFRALVLFAREDYQAAATAIYAVLAVSPGWDWTTLSGLYADQEEFARQLRSLEAAHKNSPDSAAIAFLRGYHYTTCRHFEAAVKQFQTAVKLLPGDDLIPALATLIAGAVESPAATATPPDTPPATSNNPPDPAPKPIAKAMLVGEWKAFRGGTVSIQLKLRDDDHFVWVATHEGKPRRMAGRYVVEGNILFLGGGSGTLVGRMEKRKQGGFNFKLLENSTTDAGLDFASATTR